MKQEQQQQSPAPPPQPPQPPQQSSPPFASPGVPAFLSKLWALLGETPSNQLITWSQVGRPHPLPARVWRSPAITLGFPPAGTGACPGPWASACAWGGRKIRARPYGLVGLGPG